MTVSRRTLVTATALLPVAGVTAAGIVDAPGAAAATPVEPPPIRPRSDWAGDLAPTGRLEDEDAVRFLLIHHTLTPNTDTAEQIPGRLQSIFRFHTSAERGWHDVAYNFFVDPFGTIWEGREGSIDRPMMGDATGGSQGFALLCCFIGDFTTEVPTPSAMNAMVHLLAWLASREGLTLEGEVSVTSRGSSKWPKGVGITTEQIAAHRDMSATECPGDALYPLVSSELLPRARTMLTAPPTPVPTPTMTPTPTPTPSAGPTASTAPGTTTDPVSGDVLPWLGGGALAVGAAGVVAALIGRRRRGSEGPEQLGDDDHAADGEGAEQAEEEPDGRP
ncbi:MAG TPA: hypothetical protein GXZ45_08460 [Propionibacterium sp.]|nr:hypothetical protein [Propionibacterium sp.]